MGDPVMFWGGVMVGIMMTVLVLILAGFAVGFWDLDICTDCKSGRRDGTMSDL